MLSIKITPTALYFKDLQPDLILKFNQLYNMTESKKGYCIEGTEKQLFKILLKLSYDYDIELT